MKKVFLSAYGCEPYQGSEHEIGWRWAEGLSSRVKLTVLTRESNRYLIEKKIAELGADSPLNKVRFLYYDLGKGWLFLKKKRVLPMMAYYVLWQYFVRRRYGELADSADVVHHVTFVTLLCPGFWKTRHARFVIGPVGAPVVNPYYLRIFGRKAWIQRLRNFVMLKSIALGPTRRVLSRANIIVPANHETKSLIERNGLRASSVLLDTGSPDAALLDARNKRKLGDQCKFIFAGKIERRKGLEIALHAFKKASSAIDFNGTFDILGDGPYRQQLEALSQRLGLDDRVSFLGSVPKAQVLSHFSGADVFLFTSVRDVSAGVNLEAMAAGLPIVCISHQGVADITSDDCALRISLAPYSETIESLAQGITKISNDFELRQKLGRNGRLRAESGFSWDEKFDRMLDYYEL